MRINFELQNYSLTWFSSAFCRPGLKLKISLTSILNSILLTSRTAKIGKWFVLWLARMIWDIFDKKINSRRSLLTSVTCFSVETFGTDSNFEEHCISFAGYVLSFENSFWTVKHYQKYFTIPVITIKLLWSLMLSCSVQGNSSSLRQTRLDELSQTDDVA